MSEWEKLADWLKHMQGQFTVIQHDPIVVEHLASLREWERMARAAKPDDAEAADEIERLRAALEPFARLQPVTIGFAATFRKPDWADCDWAVGFEGLQPEFKHFREAALALSRPDSWSDQ